MAGLTNSAITKHTDFNPLDLVRIATRTPKPIAIVEYNPSWPADFARIESLVRTALGDRAVLVQHVGSTSVPGLPAKDVIDIDIAVADPTAEDTYVPALESAGFLFLHREPSWHEHRYFGLAEPYANVHVFGPDSPELVRHRLFRDWLIEHADDRELYAQAKRKAAAESRAAGEDTIAYNSRKEPVVQEILERVFRAAGLLE